MKQINIMDNEIISSNLETYVVLKDNQIIYVGFDEKLIKNINLKDKSYSIEIWVNEKIYVKLDYTNIEKFDYLFKFIIT